MGKGYKVLRSTAVAFYGPGIEIVMAGFKWTVTRGSDLRSVSVTPHSSTALPDVFFSVSPRGEGVDVGGEPDGESKAVSIVFKQLNEMTAVELKALYDKAPPLPKQPKGPSC